MKSNTASLILVAALLLSGCTPGAQSVAPTSTITAAQETSESADAVKATSTVEGLADSEASMEGASTSKSDMDATVEAVVSATIAANIAGSPVPESETDQAEDVEEAVEEMQWLIETVDAYVVNSMLDMVLTDEEMDELEALLADAMVALEYSLYLIETYEEYFEYISGEDLDALYALIDDIEEIEALLDDVLVLLETGVENAGEILADLEQLIDQAADVAGTAFSHAEQWRDDVQANVTQRMEELQALQPDILAGSRADAINLARDYIDGVQAAFTDGLFTPEELQQIGQLGINASAGLEQYGGERLSQFGNMIHQTTAAAASGQFGQVQSQLDRLHSGIPARP